MGNSNFLSKMSIKQKIIALAISVAVLIMSISLFFSLTNIKNSLISANKDKVNQITELVSNILDSYKKDVDAKIMPLAEAQKRAIKEISAIRYDGNNYICINDYNNKMLVHPTLRGKNASDIADKNGVRFIAEGTKLAKEKGNGFVEYQWTKQGEDNSNVYPKVSFYRNYPDWHWVIATGAYLDEVNNDVRNVFLQILFINIVVMIIVIAVVLGTIVRDIANSMGEITGDLEGSSHGISSASSQLDAASQKLAEGSSEQAASIQETSSTLEETASMVQQNRENTKQAASLAKQSKEYANNSNAQMQKMMVAMDDLKKSSAEISKIIRVIDEIAFQTNILSLNAAVEAARAGDAGKGFAVVAEEVRSLAQRSAQAAQDTTQIIESNIALSENGARIAKDVQQSVSEIDIQSKKVSDLLDEIAVATDEQAQGVSQINKAIAQMEIVLSSNASTAEESASASRDLYEQTLKMNEIISRLNQVVDGQNDSYSSVGYQRPAILKKSLPKLKEITVLKPVSGDLSEF